MPTPFFIIGRQFAEKLIRIRFGLIRRGYSNNDFANHAARELKLQLDYYPFDSDIKMASFFIRYQEQLLDAIPGGQSGCGPKLIMEYTSLLSQAKNIVDTALCEKE